MRTKSRNLNTFCAYVRVLGGKDVRQQDQTTVGESSEWAEGNKGPKPYAYLGKAKAAQSPILS